MPVIVARPRSVPWTYAAPQHGSPPDRRPVRLRTRAPPADLLAACRAAARGAERRERDPPLRGGRGRARTARRAAPGPADDPARLDRRHRGPRARVRPQLPAHVRARAHSLGADRGRAAPRRGDAADRRLPDQRPALRQGRTSPRLGRPRARPHRHQRLRDRGSDPGRAGGQVQPPRPAAEEPPAALPRARAAGAEGARAHPALGRVALRGAGRGQSRRGAFAPSRSAAS